MNTIPLQVKTPEQVAKEADGWIEWNGGECPTDKEDAVDVRFRNGEISSYAPAGSWFWGKANCMGDIIAYRLRKPKHTDCCGNPATCEQPCFHSAGRTTPGTAGAIARKPDEALPLTALDVQEGGSHYKDMAIQPVEYIHANGLPFIEGAIVKYASRHRKKGGAQDVRKIIHFARLLLKLEYGVDE